MNKSNCWSKINSHSSCANTETIRSVSFCLFFTFFLSSFSSAFVLRKHVYIISSLSSSCALRWFLIEENALQEMCDVYMCMSCLLLLYTSLTWRLGFCWGEGCIGLEMSRYIVKSLLHNVPVVLVRLSFDLSNNAIRWYGYYLGPPGHRAGVI